jgi:hypothetical protein
MKRLTRTATHKKHGSTEPSERKRHLRSCDEEVRRAAQRLLYVTGGAAADELGTLCVWSLLGSPHRNLK